MEIREELIKTGKEQFIIKNNTLNFFINDFWSWAHSDLLSNTLRGILAEFIVKQDLKIKTPIRKEWNSFDLLSKKGSKIEVKSSAYLQSWKQKKITTISFNIAPTKSWDSKTNQYSSIIKRQSDYYIFCLLHHKDKETVNPINLSQWTFYVLKTGILNKEVSNQKSISLSRLLKLNPNICRFGEINNHIL